MKDSEDMRHAYQLLDQRYIELMQQKMQGGNLADCQDVCSDFAALAHLAIQELRKVTALVERHERFDPRAILRRWRSTLPTHLQ